MAKTSDFGPRPFVVNIESATLSNENYRTTLWTGKNIQLTLMTIQPSHEIGLEVHADHDQFLRIEEGQATVYIGPSSEDLQMWVAGTKEAIFVPAGMWHNLVNSGNVPLKLYSIYGPPEHSHGTIHVTKEDADNDPHEH